MTPGIGRTLRAVIGNAIVWGASWTGLSLAMMAALRPIGIIPADIGPLDMLGMAVRIGFVGGLAGTAFAGYLRLAKRGRRLPELSALRIGVGSGIAAGVLVPTLMQLASLASGGGFVAWRDINTDIVIVTLFGGIAAGVSVKLAQLASRFVPDAAPPAIDEADVLERLGPVMDAERFAQWGRREAAAPRTPASPRGRHEP
jgi:hypothetical protein